MSGYWRAKAAPIIAEVLRNTRGLPEREVRRALRDAWPPAWGEMALHPYKIWLDEIARQTGKKPPLGTVTREHVREQREAEDPRQGKLF